MEAKAIKLGFGANILVPNWIVACLVSVFRKGGGLGKGESYIAVVLFDSLMPDRRCPLVAPSVTVSLDIR